ncbi:unnamed protein product, partial [Urochloa humidicola]
ARLWRYAPEATAGGPCKPGVQQRMHTYMQQSEQGLLSAASQRICDSRETEIPCQALDQRPARLQQLASSSWTNSGNDVLGQSAPLPLAIQLLQRGVAWLEQR